MPRVPTNKPSHGFGAFGIGPGAPVIASSSSDIDGLLDGAHDFTSTVTDAAGETSAASAASVMLAAQALAGASTIASSLHDASVTNLAINDTADHVINAANRRM